MRKRFLVTKKKRSLPKDKVSPRQILSDGKNIYYKKDAYEPKMVSAATAAGDVDPYIENLNMQMICKECKEFPPNLVEEFSSGDMVCGSCGLVLGDRIVDTRSEWRTFANDDQGNDDPSRVGDAANPLLNGSQLSTTIAFGDGSGRSRDLQRAQNKASFSGIGVGLSWVRPDEYALRMSLSNPISGTPRSDPQVLKPRLYLLLTKFFV